MDSEKRMFRPKRIDDLKKDVLPYIGKEVTVLSWHQNISMKETHPEDKCVGFVKEFCLDIPKSELVF